MQPIYKHLVRFFVISALLFNTCANAETVKSKKPQFKVTTWEKWDSSPILLKTKNERGKEEMVSIETMEMSYSRGYPYQKGAPIKFYTETNDPETPYKLFKSIQIPQNIKSPLILFLTINKELRTLIFDLDASDFKYGSYKLVNLSQKEILYKIDNKRIKLKPLASRNVPIATSGKKKAVHCQAAVLLEGKPKIVYSTMLMNRSEKRQLIFFYSTKDSKGREVVKSRSLVDFKPQVSKQSDV
ncbi:hypothetical protein [Rubritalea tangerina]|uniref:DUF1571 domain-containing protein n=1 Tax=Rubritalea tangerina TaxID=430798 RepID=A0ABW4Z623_9BACT